MLHSLFLTHWYPSEANPLNGTFVREHARAVSRFHKVTLIHIQGIDLLNPGVSLEEDEELTVYHLRYPKPKFPKTGWISLLSGVNRIFNEIAREHHRPDIIHAHIYSSAAPAYFLSRIYNIPLVLTEQASSFPRNLFTRTQRLANRFFLNRLDLMLPVSAALGEFIQRDGIKTRQVVIPNAVDTSVFYPALEDSPRSAAKIRLLTVARLSPIKGIDWLLRGFHQLPNQESVELWVVGDGPELSSLVHLVSELNLSESVQFLGAKSKPEIAALMRQSHVFVLTSLWDSSPVVIIEALASGLPVVATDVGGIPELVKPFCGRLVSPADVDEISEGIGHVVNHLAEYSQSRITAYAQREFSLLSVGKRYSDVYQEILGKRLSR